MQTPFDPLAQKYPSQRYPIYARGGMVNTSSPQASAAGLSVLQKGGNAIDAAVAAAAALLMVLLCIAPLQTVLLLQLHGAGVVQPCL